MGWGGGRTPPFPSLTPHDPITRGAGRGRKAPIPVAPGRRPTVAAPQRWRRDPGGSGAAGCYAPHTPTLGHPRRSAPPHPKYPLCPNKPPPPHLVPQLRGCPARKKAISSKSFIPCFRPTQFLLFCPAAAPWVEWGAQPGGGGTQSHGVPMGRGANGTPQGTALRCIPALNAAGGTGLCAVGQQRGTHLITGSSAGNGRAAFLFPKLRTGWVPGCRPRCCAVPAVRSGIGRHGMVYRGTPWHGMAHGGTASQTMAHYGT